jgi:hypothetical protein
MRGHSEKDEERAQGHRFTRHLYSFRCFAEQRITPARFGGPALLDGVFYGQTRGP